MMEKEISDYDKFEYDYKEYWSGKAVNRNYENETEKRIVKKNTPKSGKWVCDLGGGFGRLYDCYKDSFEHKILADYSLENLRAAKKSIDDPSLHLIATNAYHLPFRDNTLDFLVSVRLMHHIEDIGQVFGEISRVVRPGERALIEYANKRHFFEIFRYLLGRSKMDPFSTRPKKRGDDLFYNFHPKYIQKKLVDSKFSIIKAISSSNFRSGTLKKVLGTRVLLFLDRVLSPIFNLVKFGPSIFVLVSKLKTIDDVPAPHDHLHDILLCPKCGSKELIFFENKVYCKSCEKNYPIVDRIYDFRVE